MRRRGTDDHESAELEEPETPGEDVQDVGGPERCERERSKKSTKQMFIKYLPCARHYAQCPAKTVLTGDLEGNSSRFLSRGTQSVRRLDR